MVQTFFRRENKDQAVCSWFQQISLILYTSDGAEVSCLQDLYHLQSRSHGLSVTYLVCLRPVYKTGQVQNW